MNITHDNEGFKESSKDSIVQDVINQFKLRSSIGIRKYGVTLDREDLTTLEWLNHLQEELQDATLYVQRIKKELDSKIANEDLDHWCAYSGIDGENRKELERIINVLIHGKQ